MLYSWDGLTGSRNFAAIQFRNTGMKHNFFSRRGVGQPFIRFVTVFLLVAFSLLTGCSGNPDTARQPSVTLAAVGDTNGYNILLGDQAEDPLQAVKSLLEEQDVFIFNYEGILFPETPPLEIRNQFPNQSFFWSQPQIADFLHPTMCTIVTLANNHILDCGVSGIRETVREMTSRGILTTGAGENLKQAGESIRQQVNGVDLRVIAYLAMDTDLFSAGPDDAGAAYWEEDSGKPQIVELAATTDVLVVALHSHLGEGWTDQPSQEHVELVKSILDAGADIVIAHGSHVPQGIIVSDGGVAFLSLGNFLFRPDYQMPEMAHDSMMVKITVTPDNLDVTLIPLKLDVSGKPEIPPESEASRMLSHIAYLSAQFGTAIEISGNTGSIIVHR